MACGVLGSKQAGASEALVDPSRDGLKVLVVDDDVDAADSLAAFLTLGPYDTKAAYGGQQALSLATTFEPNVVFLDINMPRMDGYAAAKALRRMFSIGPPLLIAFTGQAEPVNTAAAEQAGFDLHVRKPCDYENLLGLLDKAISKRYFAK